MTTQPVDDEADSTRIRPVAATTNPRARARRGEGDRLRDEIIAAAERLLIETGDADKVSVRAIAEAVGVTPPSIYLHFADKAELLLTLCEQRFGEFHRMVEEAIGDTDDPRESLRRQGRAYVRFGIEHPEHYRLLFMVRHQKERALEDVPTAAAAFVQLVDLVQRCIDLGVYGPGDPIVIATGMWTMVHGLTSLLISVPSFPWPDVDVMIEHLLDVRARGLAPAPESDEAGTVEA